MTEKQRKRSSITELDWTEEARNEMFTRVILAVDSTRGEAEAFGHTDWMRYCEEQLFPFLEAEKEKAKTEEAEREQVVRYLMGDAIGATEGEARLLLRDDDLWLLPPEARYSYALDGEAGVRHWQTAARLEGAWRTSQPTTLTRPTRRLCSLSGTRASAQKRLCGVLGSGLRLLIRSR